MQILEVDLVVYKGTRFRFDLLITENGANVDLAGYSAKLQVRDSEDAETALLELTSGAALSFSNSTLLIRIPGSQVYDFTAGEYDVKIWPPSSEVNADLVMRGKFLVKTMVTR